LRLGGSVEGYCAASTPSSVAVLDGHVFFADTAEQTGNSATIFRSLKVCTACQYGALTCRGCPNRSTDCLPGRGGLFNVSTNGKARRASAQDLLALYVAWARHAISQQLRDLLPALKPNRVLWNISVPLGQVEQFAIKDAYKVLLHSAVELEGLVEQGVELDAVLDCLRHTKREVTRDPNKMSTSFALVPETLAALLGYISLPTTELGLYGIVDVGAGTTDVSFFDVYDKAQRKIAFYGSDANAVGGDDFDVAAARVMAEGAVTSAGAPTEAIVAGIRASRAKGNGVFSVGEHRYDLSTREVNTVENRVADRVWNAVHDVFDRVYVRKLRNTGYWRRLPLLLIGGGSLNSRVVKALERTLCPYTIDQPVTRLRPSRSMTPGPGLCTKDVEESTDFLLVAYGLSHPEPEHPGFIPPSDIPDFQKPPEAERFDANDMYGK
jgi:hypothetical protein